MVICHFTRIHSIQASNIRLLFRFAFFQSFYTLDMHLFHPLSKGEVNTSAMSPPDKHLISYVFVLQSLTTVYQVLNVFLLPHSDRSIFLPPTSSCNRGASDLGHLFDIPHNSVSLIHTPGNSFLGQIRPV